MRRTVEVSSQQLDQTTLTRARFPSMLLRRRRGARVSSQPRDFECEGEHGSNTMGKVLDEDLIYEILSVVAEIPAGSPHTVR